MTLYFSDFEWYMIDLIDMKNLWTPIVYIGSAKNVQKLGSFGEESLSYLWYQFSRHMMHYSEIVTATVFCELDFKHFPFDSHECILDLKNWIGWSEVVVLNSPLFTKENEKIKSTNLTNPRLKFDFTFESLPSKTFPVNGYPYSMTQIKMNLTR